MVHWDQEKIKKVLIAKLVTLMVVVSSVILMNDDSDATAAGQTKLKVSESLNLPMAELSGTATSTSADGKTTLYAVSDAASTLLSAELDGAGQLVPDSIKSRDFAPALIERFALCKPESGAHCGKLIKELTTQWEAVAVDGAGRVFLVQETSSTIVVLTPDLSRVMAVLAFDFFRTKSGERHQPGKKGAANLAEGIVLLANGHVIIAKEGFPATLTEFGPSGDAPLGLSAETLLKNDAIFKLPGIATDPFVRADLVALATWTRKNDDGACDQSELAVKPDGKLYVLSQRCQLIWVYPGLAVDTLVATPSSAWSLPGKIQHPEALVPLAEGSFLVGSDNKGKKPNLFRLIER